MLFQLDVFTVWNHLTHSPQAVDWEAAALRAVQVQARLGDSWEDRPPIELSVIGHQLPEMDGIALERFSLEHCGELWGEGLREAALGVAIGERIHVHHGRLDVGETRCIIDALAAVAPVGHLPLARRMPCLDL